MPEEAKEFEGQKLVWMGRRGPLVANCAKKAILNGLRFEGPVSPRQAVRALLSEAPALLVTEGAANKLRTALRKNWRTLHIPILVLAEEGQAKATVLTYYSTATSATGVFEAVVASLSQDTPDPVSMPEIEKREPRSLLREGPFALDPGEKSSEFEDRDLNLTITEFNLLYELLKDRGKTLSRAQLLARAWGLRDFSGKGHTRTADMHVKRLRHKLGENAKWVETVRGVGYRIRIPDHYDYSN